MQKETKLPAHSSTHVPQENGACPAVLPPPPLDRIELNVSGRAGSLRQHAIWITGKNINYIEEQALNRIAKLIEDRALLPADVERALYSWGVSSGKNSLRYFLAIIDRLMDSAKVHSMQRRAAEVKTSNRDDGKVKKFNDHYVGEQFAEFLEKQGVRHRAGVNVSTGTLDVWADNVESLYRTYEKSLEKSHEG